ncbi:SDR family oxidoreductase [Bradyrhizobium sp.]|uniref:SDR family oxidoreductase n=1 Tax=Bradyrhizobium sp. TaxID=376 RepID=UPI0039E5BFDB
MEFAGKRALVTGAGKGIGRETARLLVKMGATVVALSRTAADLETLKEEIGCETLTVDIANEKELRAAVQSVLPIDLVANCAGATALDPLHELTTDTFSRLMAINAIAPLAVVQEVSRDMIARKAPGSIVNVSSMAAFVGIPSQTAYCASKAALDAMTRVMAIELGPHNIRVNGINPTVTLTAMAKQAWSDPAKRAARLARIPLGRFAEPSEVADLIAYLLSDRASMVHGVALPIDGGFRAI